MHFVRPLQNPRRLFCIRDFQKFFCLIKFKEEFRIFKPPVEFFYYAILTRSHSVMPLEIGTFVRISADVMPATLASSGFIFLKKFLLSSIRSLSKEISLLKVCLSLIQQTDYLKELSWLSRQWLSHVWSIPVKVFWRLWFLSTRIIFMKGAKLSWRHYLDPKIRIQLFSSSSKFS